MKPRRNTDIETKLLPDGHVVLFSTKSDWAHTITPLAAVAWEYCDGSNTLEQIVTSVAEVAKKNNVFQDLDAKTFESKIHDLMKELETTGLVVQDQSS